MSQPGHLPIQVTLPPGDNSTFEEEYQKAFGFYQISAPRIHLSQNFLGREEANLETVRVRKTFGVCQRLLMRTTLQIHFFTNSLRRKQTNMNSKIYFVEIELLFPRIRSICAKQFLQIFLDFIFHLSFSFLNHDKHAVSLLTIEPCHAWCYFTKRRLFFFI